MNKPTTTARSDLALLIESRRAELGYSQRALGKLVGVEAGTVGNWENGTAIPQYRHIPKLAKALNWPVKDLGKMVVQARRARIDKGDANG